MILDDLSEMFLRTSKLNKKRGVNIFKPQSPHVLTKIRQLVLLSGKSNQSCDAVSLKCSRFTSIYKLI
jgi:hypothetical protein